MIHLNCQGALPNPSPYYFQNSANGGAGDDSDSDGEDYWFQNADPKRPKIKQPPASQPPKRIFHKLEPQVRPKFEELSPSNLANNIQGRLPRKTIKDVKENDEEEEDDDMDQDHQGLKRNKNKKEESQSPSIKKEDPNLKEQLNESKEVLTLPEPGESSTDPDDASNDDHVVQNTDTSNTTASIKEAGQKLGGEANVAFESEEDDEYDHNDTPDTAIQSSVISHKMSENNDYSTSTNSNKAQINQQQEPMHVLPALFFIHGVGGSANVWANQLSFFASLGHEVIAPDLLGMSVSKKDYMRLD